MVWIACVLLRAKRSIWNTGGKEMVGVFLECNWYMLSGHCQCLSYTAFCALTVFFLARGFFPKNSFCEFSCEWSSGCFCSRRWEPSCFLCTEHVPKWTAARKFAGSVPAAGGVFERLPSHRRAHMIVWTKDKGCAVLYSVEHPWVQGVNESGWCCCWCCWCCCCCCCCCCDCCSTYHT